MRLPVTIDLRDVPEVLDTLTDAISLRACPRGWRYSEYIATKAVAQRIVKALQENLVVRAEYFDVSCLSGELARLYKHIEATCKSLDNNDPLLAATVDRGARALSLFTCIHKQCLSDPAVAAAIAESDAFEKESRRLEKARHRLEAMEKRFMEQELEFRQRKGP